MNTMKKIGLIGGMSWESTAYYYKIINTTVKEQLGGLHSAKCILYSVDFHEIEIYQHKGEWDKCAAALSDAALSLEKAGAEFFLICTNTMHKVAGEVQKAISIPLLHIADVTAEILLRKGIKKIGLLGTKYTMEEDFYTSRLAEKGLEALIPDSEARQEINRVIYEELCLGIIKEESKKYYLDCIQKLAKSGVEAVILGCTEIGILVRQSDTEIPLFDTTLIHAQRAALHSLQ